MKASCGLDFSHTLRARKSASKQSGFQAVAAGVSLRVVVRVLFILNDVVLYVLAFHANYSERLVLSMSKKCLLVNKN